jgi:hypothetical protein
MELWKMDSHERALATLNGLEQDKLNALDEVGNLIDNAKRDGGLTAHQAKVLNELKKVIGTLVIDVATLQRDYAHRNTGPA